MLKTWVIAAGSALAMTSALALPPSHSPDPVFHDGMEGVAAGPFNDADAARFLAQATFGPTATDIAYLRALGYQGWLDLQFAAPASKQVPYLDWVQGLPAANEVTDDTRLQIWTINSLGAKDRPSSPCHSSTRTSSTSSIGPGTARK